MFWCVLVRSLCSLLDLHSPWFICDVAVWHSCILIVARGFRTWASAFRVLLQVLLHAHIGLVTFPCLWRRDSFPHSLPFYAPGTASTLTASWSRWRTVTSVPVAAGFRIWLDWFSRPQGHNAIGRIMSMKNSNDTIWNRTSDLPICSTAP